MKKIFLHIFVLINIINLSAQKISFEHEKYNFGSFKEEAGPQTHKFKFKNTGNRNLVITDVKASCGCTTPEWTKAPIAPGKSGYVIATFNPKNRPGPFSKTITVKSNSDTPVKILTITGKVLPREKTITDKYPQKIGNLMVKSTQFIFSRIKNTKHKTDSLPVYNGSSSNISVEFVDVPKYITLKMIPKTLKPGQKGNIIGTYYADKVNDYGFIIDRIKLKINGKTIENNLLSVSAIIEEDFSKLTAEQKANAPKASFNTKVFNFGVINSGEKKSFNFILKNEGKSDLIIRKIKSSCNCTVAEPETRIIKPGKTATIKATFDSTGKIGRQKKTITIVTNDPENTITRLTVIGDVK